jgi:hypothetical protein
MYSGVHEIHYALTMRYLGSILEFPVFWQSLTSIPHRHALQKLLLGITRLLQDIGIDCEDLSNPSLNKICDNEGADSLVYSILRGIGKWMETQNRNYLEDQPWWDNFLSILTLMVMWVCPL